jgi:transposase
VQKDQLSIRPIWHQRANRVEAHILVCFLAFVLWKTLELWQRRAELGNSPRTVLEEIKRIQYRLGITLPKRLRIDEIDLPI